MNHNKTCFLIVVEIITNTAPFGLGIKAFHKVYNINLKMPFMVL
jgi:hypothetical protein